MAMLDRVRLLPQQMPATDGPDELLPVMASLDRFLEFAVATARNVFAQQAEMYPQLRGLCTTEADVERHLQQDAGAAVAMRGWSPEFAEGSRLAWIQRTFGLTRFDMAALIMALAPDLDLRYERVYAYLQDDITRKRPTVDLALALLCPTFKERVRQRSRFAMQAPLISHSVIDLVADSSFVEPPLLAHALRVEPQIIRLLLSDDDGVDERLACFSRRIEPVEAPVDADLSDGLTSLALRAWKEQEPLRLYFRGSDPAALQAAVVGLATSCGMPVLHANLARALALGNDLVETFRILIREAWFFEAILYLDGIDALRAPEHASSWRALMRMLDSDQRVVVMGGAQAWNRTGDEPAGVLEYVFGVPSAARRRSVWLTALAQAASAPTAPSLNGLPIEDIDDLAARFRLAPGQIVDAVALARSRALLRASTCSSTPQGRDDVRFDPSDLFSAARVCSGHALAAVARQVAPGHTWQDIVLPPGTAAQLRELCDQARLGHVVYEGWGFGRRLVRGRALNVLFCGPPGTGKTMAADVIASELRLDLYKIDLSQVVSKYIGDTEKRLDRIFNAAEASNAILLFDEADALFGKRSQVKDAHDRYANIEVGYLLQKMEEYEGIAILCTNLRANMDEAFTRRLRFIVEFPFPEASDRLRIWKTQFPPEAPRGQDIDFDFLARQFRLTGASIRNIVLNASFLAASGNSAVGMGHLLCATRREFAKMGRDCMPAEFGPYLDTANAFERSSRAAEQRVS